MALPEFSHLPPLVSLRGVEEEDEAFLFELFRETSARVFGPLDLPGEQLEALLMQQYRAREAGWRDRHPMGMYQLVIHDTNPAGYLALGELEGQIILIYLGLARRFRGRGIASGLLRNLQNVAERNSQKIWGHVEVGNPALGFWEHHEFKVVQELGPHVVIEWSPP